LELKLNNACDKGEINDITSIEIIMSNYFIQNLNNEVEKIESREEKKIFYQKNIDKLCRQRVPGKFDRFLENKITLGGF